MYFDEEMVLDIRLNILDAFVDHFVIVESKYNHKGEKRKLLFNKEKFSKFENKIIYLIYDEIPSKVTSIKFNDSEKTKDTKYIMNALYRENEQRNYIINGLTKASDDDIVFVSDVDEIPKIDNINFDKLNNKIMLFKQDMFYYKFNLSLPNFKWTGSKACRKKKPYFSTMVKKHKRQKISFF